MLLRMTLVKMPTRLCAMISSARMDMNHILHALLPDRSPKLDYELRPRRHDRELLLNTFKALNGLLCADVPLRKLLTRSCS